MKRFNTTGVCIERKHYMVDISRKLDEIECLINDEFYFVINRPRQYGKTTTLNELYKRLKSKYVIVRVDFELMAEEFIIESLSREIYKFTSGYPFLVSRICQLIDEKIIGKIKRAWTIEDVQKATKILLLERNTLFDDLIKNLENNKDLYDYIYDMLILDVKKYYNSYSLACNMGFMFGYFKELEGFVSISNKIFTEIIYNYMIAKVDNKVMSKYNFKEKFLTDDNGLDMKKILLKFQQFMKENYSEKDKDFLETHGRLLFLAFIKPIINGVGFDYKEVQISTENLIDLNGNK
ncbi:MAG: hypothetical protein ACRDD2_09675 [Sarcina sp.]